MYNTIFQKILFPIAELASGTTIQKKLKFLLESQYWNRAQIEAYQNKRLKELIEHAYANVPYYTKLFDKLGLKPSDIQNAEDLKKLPILTKQIIRENAEELHAKNVKGFAAFTSGSTGTPMKFYQTKEDYSWQWAAHFRAWSWAGYSLGDKYVKISLNNSRIKLSKKMQDSLMRCYYVYALNMDEKALDKYVKEIFKFKPKIVYGYSSSLNIIAEYMRKNNLSYKAKAIITTGENLLPNNRKTIEKIFSCKIFDGYGCGGEGLNIAAQCIHGHYHVNDELQIVEEDHNEITITSLNNYAMPLIRYKPNDLVSLGHIECKTGIGLSTIKNLNGRSRDVVNTPRGDMVVHFFTVLFEYIPGIKQFKIIQKNKKGISINIVKDKNFKGEKKIISEIQKVAGEDFEIEMQYVDNILPEKNGKMKLIDNRL